MSQRFQTMLERGRKRPRGSVLFLTLLFLVLINLFAVAFWKLVPVEMHNAKRQQQETEAYFASDAGIIDSLAFLQDATSRGNLDNFITDHGEPNADGHRVLLREGELNGWSWRCEIIPGEGTFGHKDFAAANPLRTFRLESVATDNKKISGGDRQNRRVSAWVRQRSFAEFNWNCSEYDDGNPLYLFMNTFRLGGHYRTNGPALLRIRKADNFWDIPEPAIRGDLIFHEARAHPSLGMVDGVHYTAGTLNWGGQDSLPYWESGSDKGEPRGDRYEKLTTEGRAGVKHRPRLEMPENTDSIAYGVWGDDIPTAALDPDQLVFEDDSKVNIAINDQVEPGTAHSGIWIDGNVSQVEFSLSNNFVPHETADMSQAENGNQVMKVWQGNQANNFVEVTFVKDVPMTIPAGADIRGDVTTTNLDPAANDGKGYTVVRNGNDNVYRIYRGQTNGAIYATGNVNGVRGVVKGRRTIGVSTDTGTSKINDHEIRINGDLLYANTRRGQPPVGGGLDMLGLIGYAVRMEHAGATAAPTAANPQLGKIWPRRQDYSPSNELDAYHLYVSIFAGRRNDPNQKVSNATTIAGGFGSSQAGSATYGKAHMIVYGSITEGVRQHKGSGDHGSGGSGNSYEFYMDDNLSRVQPPFFPSVPEYDIMTWQEESVFSF